MKSFIYHLFALPILLIGLAACNKDDNTELGKEPNSRTVLSPCKKTIGEKPKSNNYDFPQELITFSPLSSKPQQEYFVYNHFELMTPCDLTRLDVKIHTKGNKLWIEEKMLDGGNVNCLCPRDVAKIVRIPAGEYEIILNEKSLGTHQLSNTASTIIKLEDVQPVFDIKYILGELPYLGLTDRPWVLEHVRMAENIIGTRVESPKEKDGALTFVNKMGKFFSKVHYLTTEKGIIQARLKEDLSKEMKDELIQFMLGKGFSISPTTLEGYDKTYIHNAFKVAMHFKKDGEILINKKIRIEGTPTENSQPVSLGFDNQQARYTEACNAKAWKDLASLAELSPNDKNLIYSYYSMMQPWAMLHNAASNDGIPEIDCITAIHPPLNEQWYNEYWDLLKRNFNITDSETRMSTANTIFSSHLVSPLPSFLDVLKAYYDCDPQVVDFSQKEQTATLINEWVKEHTMEMIPSFILPEELQENMVSLLVNAIYLKASWSKGLHFDVQKTQARPFASLGNIPTMNQKAEMCYYHSQQGFSSVSLPLGNGSFEAIFILPDNGESPLSIAKQIANTPHLSLSGHMTEVDLYLPKFKVIASSPLNKMYKRDHGKLYKKEGLFLRGWNNPRFVVSQVTQKCIVSVDEKGAEAAAASAITIEPTAVEPQDPITLHFDRPFLFLIRHTESQMHLFSGIIYRPEWK
ncbi:hypothetical protein HQ45_03760 [Porphyromonas crevioricanis]|uniref:serpin family protein n=1 Tax=Porphyromonas crevioricanis TaxID=393921 RepID=UPI00052D3271|nr:serpin family protein [Porphyromonas crevioricanis]KGN89953.1 hypothetical protein HQ45_03760 [Porphyromonas crevioricanis]